MKLENIIDSDLVIECPGSGTSFNVLEEVKKFFDNYKYYDLKEFEDALDELDDDDVDLFVEIASSYEEPVYDYSKGAINYNLRPACIEDVVSDIIENHDLGNWHKVFHDYTFTEYLRRFVGEYLGYDLGYFDECPEHLKDYLDAESYYVDRMLEGSVSFSFSPSHAYIRFAY